MSSEEVDYVTTCVSCGGPIEVKNKLRSRHVCSEKRESARKSAHSRAYEATTRRETFGQRLSAGFEMLADDEAISKGEE